MMSRRLLLAAGLAGLRAEAQASDDPLYQVGNLRDDFLAYAVEMSYVPGQVALCSQQLEAPFHDDVNVRSHTCWTKCRPGAAGNPSGTPNTAGPYYCGGYSGDTDGSNALCLDESHCKELCNSLDDCAAYAIASAGSTRCYLLPASCIGDATGTQGGAFQQQDKSFGEVPSCPLGLGVRVDSDKYAATTGLYEWRSATEYQQLDGPHRVVWHASSCGWTVERDNSTTAPPAAPAPQCVDDVATANFACFQTGSEYQEDACQAAQAWGSGSYCDNVIFAGLCPATCSVATATCLGDNDAAAQEIQVMQGVASPVACSAADCTDPLIKSVCKASCPARRLEASELQKAPKWGDAFRTLLAGQAQQRRLAWTNAGKYEELYATFNPASCTPFAGVRVEELNKLALYDVRDYYVPVVDFNATWVCPFPTTFLTESGKFCQHNNLLGKYNEDPEIVNNQCAYKCGTDTTTASTYCTGNSATIAADTNALCLPREQCESICARLDNCHSIDMHRELPRCYLNTFDCDVPTGAAPYVADAVWDVLVKSTRPERVSFTNFFEYQCIVGDEWSSVDANHTRAMCEDACAASATCAGYQYLATSNSELGVCTLKDATCDPAQLANGAVFTAAQSLQAFAFKDVPVACHVDVMGTQYAGRYVADAHVDAVSYYTLDNRMRLTWEAGVANQCNGWSFETNAQAESSVFLPNCTDNDLAANIYAHGSTTASYTQFPCRQGASAGSCSDVVFKGLCAAACATVQSTVYGGQTFYHHDTTLGTDSDCLTDNNEAIVAAMAAGKVADGQTWTYDSSTMPDTACQTMANWAGTWFNYDQSPCHVGLYAPLSRQLCKATCDPLSRPPAPAPAPALDESNWAIGASRRLTPTSVNHQQGYGVTVQWLTQGGTPWTKAYRTWPSGAQDASMQSAGATNVWHFGEGTAALTTPGVACDSSAGQVPQGPLANSTMLYRWDFVRDPTANMSYVCRNQSACPELHTCVVSKGQLENEMSYFRGGKASWGQWLSEVNEVERRTVLSAPHFVPRTFMSAERGEALIAASKFTVQQSQLFRNVPAASRVRFEEVGAADTILVASVVSPSAVVAGVPVAQIQLGRTYPQQANFQAWKTDVLRVERFRENGVSAKQGRFVFQFYAPGARMLTVFKYDSLTSTGERLSGEAVTKLEDGWFRVTVDSVDADFVATEDVYECEANPCHEKAKCTENLGALATCTCEAPYFGDGITSCVREGVQFNSDPVPLHYFRLSHTDRLDHGWHITDIRMYSDDACTVEFTRASYGGNSAGTGAWASGEYPTYQYPNPPTPKTYVVGNAFDTDVASMWKSSCLNCNPAVKDDTHGAAAWVQWTFLETHAGEQVRCVKVVQDTANGNRHQATKLRLERGPASGDNCGLGVGQTRCEATQSWEATAPASTSTTAIGTQCGVRNALMFGEVLVHPEDGAQTYDFHGTPSACQCQQLCIEKLHEGCRSYRFFTATGRCILQGKVTSRNVGQWGTQTGSTGFLGWESGDFRVANAMRLTGFKTSPEQVAPGKAFSLTVKGVGLPFTSDKAQDTSPRWRVKIVDADASCDAEVPVTVSGIGCLPVDAKVPAGSNKREETWHTICSPRPAETSGEHVEYKGLKIEAKKEARSYKVCACVNEAGCSRPGHFKPVPGLLSVGGSQFQWSTSVPDIFRKVLPSTDFTFDLDVKRPAFGSYSNAANWRLRLVKAQYGCGVQTDGTIMTLGAPAVVDHDSVRWGVTFNQATFKLEHTGNYVVCFSEETTGAFREIPSATARYVKVQPLSIDSSHPRGIFHNQHWTARSSADNAALVTSRIVVRGSRFGLPDAGVIAITDASAGECGSATMTDPFGNVFNTFPAGAQTRSVAMPTMAASTPEGLAYDLALGNVPAGNYRVCFCPIATDVDAAGLTAAGSGRPEFMNPGEVTEVKSFRLHDATACTNYLAAGSIHADWQPHQCSVKCDMGCVGDNCYCDHFDASSTPATTLCATPMQCRQACEASTGCLGFEVQEGKNLCNLIDTAIGSATCNTDETWLHFEFADGVACADDADFTETAGTLHVTARAFVGQDFVFSPDERASVEITAPDGQSLTWATYGPSRQRMMVVDGKGTCGVSAPSKSVVEPAQADDVSTWTNFWPMGLYQDAPHNDTQNPTTQGAVSTRRVWTYNERDGFYCPSHNMDLSQDSMRSIARHQCSTKCSGSTPCLTADCHCLGFMPGFDGPTSNALCADEALCRTFCDMLSDCSSYDMHKTLPRCFLNRQCDVNTHETQLGRDSAYKFVAKQDDITDQGTVAGGSGPTARRLHPVDRQRRLLAPQDRGFSWSRMLRFAPLRIPTGGTFKVCLCDTDLLPTADHSCQAVSDFSVEIGKLHVSGVQCFLNDPDQRFSVNACVRQYYGGLRCYTAGESVPVLPLPAEGALELSSLAFPTPEQLDTWCLFGPEEETRHDARCQQVAGYQSTV